MIQHHGQGRQSLNSNNSSLSFRSNVGEDKHALKDKVTEVSKTTHRGRPCDIVFKRMLVSRRKASPKHVYYKYPGSGLFLV